MKKSPITATPRGVAARRRACHWALLWVPLSSAEGVGAFIRTPKVKSVEKSQRTGSPLLADTSLAGHDVHAARCLQTAVGAAAVVKHQTSDLQRVRRQHFLQAAPRGVGVHLAQGIGKHAYRKIAFERGLV